MPAERQPTRHAPGDDQAPVRDRAIRDRRLVSDVVQGGEGGVHQMHGGTDGGGTDEKETGFDYATRGERCYEGECDGNDDERLAGDPLPGIAPERVHCPEGEDGCSDRGRDAEQPRAEKEENERDEERDRRHRHTARVGDFGLRSRSKFDETFQSVVDVLAHVVIEKHGARLIVSSKSDV